MGPDVSEVDSGIVNSSAGPIHKTRDNNITSLGWHRVTCPGVEVEERRDGWVVEAG